MSTVTASLGVLTKQGTFKYNKILLEIKNKLHEIKALKSYFSIWIHVKKKIKRNAEVLAHIFTILQKQLVPTSIKAATKLLVYWRVVLLQVGLHSMLVVKTPAFFFQKLVSVQNWSLFSSLLSLQKSLHSNAKTPSFEILSQYIATFFLVAWAS